MIIPIFPLFISRLHKINRIGSDRKFRSIKIKYAYFRFYVQNYAPFEIPNYHLHLLSLKIKASFAFNFEVQSNL